MKFQAATYPNQRGEDRPPKVQDLTLARSMRQARARTGLARAEVCRTLGWSPARLSALEAGESDPTLEEALALTHLYVVAARKRLDEMDDR